MSTGLLYHAFGIRGYHYTRTDYQDGQTIFTIRQEPETCRCSACGSPRLNFRGRVERRFRTVPIGRRATFVVLPIPRVECQACGVVRQVKIPFADPRRSSTNSFERYALELGRRMTIRDVALHLGVSWDVIKDIQKRDLARRFARPKLKHLRRLAIDEIAIAKGHRYLTVVLDLDSGAVVFVGDGKGAKALKPFWKRLKGSKAKIEAVAMDMSPAYREAVATHLPKATIVFDRFHVMKLFNEKLSDLRRALHREATDGMQKQVLKGTRWLLLKSAENLDEERDEKKKLEEALALNRSLATAYYLKEDLRQFWEQPGKKFATLGDRTKINSPLACLRSDYHTPLGKSLGALQTGLVPLHLLLAHTPPTLILLRDQLHFRLLPLPWHRPRPTQHCLHTRQQRPVPVHLQDPPTTLDRIVLAVIGRIVHQLDVSGPLSRSITSRFTRGRFLRLSCHHRSKQSTTKSLVKRVVPNRMVSKPLTTSRIPKGTNVASGSMSWSSAFTASSPRAAPSRENFPTCTLAFVSIEIWSVSSEPAARSGTCSTWAKIASVCLIFLRGLVFCTRRRR